MGRIPHHPLLPVTRHQLHLFKGILPGGVSRTLRFTGTLPILAPTRIPLVLSDWIIALSTRDYAQRHWADQARRARRRCRISP
jgi:hypothetical protein